MLACASGAKDIASFEVRLNDGGMPPYSSVTHEGIFYEHYFDVGKEDEALFSCDWSFASSKDPINGAMEFYVGCGMRSKLDGEGIKKHGRPPVHLVIVLDISGSMQSPFRSGESKNKLEVAIDCVLALVENLKPTDTFGLVAFDTMVDVIQEMTRVGDMNMAAFKSNVVNLRPRGGTNMEAGITGGVALLRSAARTDAKHLKRIMFLTDARPNSGATDEQQLLGICKRHADGGEQIYTTFIGLGVDFGVELVDAISHIKGCNYFTVMSSPEFKQIMERDFDYVVTPCCFDLDVRIANPSTVSINRVYGSPGNEMPEDGLLMSMLSGFPSAHDENGGTKGGIILVKVSPQKNASGLGKQTLELSLTYTDIDGQQHRAVNTIELDFGATQEQYSNLAIRKAILLTRFVNAMKWWIVDHAQPPPSEPRRSVSDTAGIPPPPVTADGALGFAPMRVSPHYKTVLRRLLDHFERAAEQLADAGDVDERLQDHAKHLVSLIEYISAADVQKVLATQVTDAEVEAGMDAEQLQKRCEEALKAADLSGRRAAFETEIKRRLKNVVVARLKAKERKVLKKALEGTADEKKQVVEDAISFIEDRPDQDLGQWRQIAEQELHVAVTGQLPRPRFRGFVM